MKILALIPARGGSKRLQGKNIRLLGGKPLIVWSIEVTRNILDICDVIVSTDDLLIAEISKNAGAYVPWIRPSELSSDTASSVDVALHAVDWYESEKGAIDGLLLLQPTSPFRTETTVLKGIELFKSHKQKPVLGISQVVVHPMWTLKFEGEYVVPYLKEHALNMRSQDLPNAYVVNGCLYLTKPATLREHRSFFGPETVPLLIESQQESLDIDTEWDFDIAENLLKKC